MERKKMEEYEEWFYWIYTEIPSSTGLATVKAVAKAAPFHPEL